MTRSLNLPRFRVQIHAEPRPGQWHWTVAGTALRGLSHEPLLDACRAIERIDAATGRQLAGLYWPGKDLPAMTCTVTWGATHTVDQRGMRFRKYEPHPLAKAKGLRRFEHRRPPSG